MRALTTKISLLIISMVFAVGAGDSSDLAGELEARYFSTLTAIVQMQEGGTCAVEDVQQCTSSLGLLIKNETIRFINEFSKLPGVNSSDLALRAKKSLAGSACFSERQTEEGSGRLVRQMKAVGEDQDLRQICSQKVSAVSNYRDVISLLLQKYQPQSISNILNRFGVLTQTNLQIFAPYTEPEIIVPKPSYTVGEDMDVRVRFFSENIIKVKTRRVEIDEPINDDQIESNSSVVENTNRARHRGNPQYRRAKVIREKYNQNSFQGDSRDDYQLELEPVEFISLQNGDVELFATLINEDNQVIHVKTADLTIAGDVVRAENESGQVMVDHKGDPRFGYFYDANFKVNLKFLGDFKVADLSLIYIPAENFVFYADKVNLDLNRRQPTIAVVPSHDFSEANFDQFRQAEVQNHAQQSLNTIDLKFNKTDTVVFRISSDPVLKRTYFSKCRQRSDLGYDCQSLISNPRGYYKFEDLENIQYYLDEYVSLAMRDGERISGSLVRFINKYMGSYIYAAANMAMYVTLDAFARQASIKTFYNSRMLINPQNLIQAGGIHRGFLKFIGVSVVGVLVTRAVMKKWNDRLKTKVGGADKTIFVLQDILNSEKEDARYFDENIGMNPDSIDVYLDLLKEAFKKYDGILEEQKRIEQMECFKRRDIPNLNCVQSAIPLEA
ncbi:MAG: hypothetical protein R2827_16025 [Bdellovibrionales bacterium]